MTKNHDSFYSAGGRRLLLVVEDETINRELLGMILGGTYDLIYAENGVQALELALAHRDELSLVLLDLIMPGMHGHQVLQTLKADPATQHLPVIVMTADLASEAESLRLGAIDFISKPYNQPEVIQARILRTIELCEDRDIIRSTERDGLTGLYNRDFFYRYAEQMDQFNRETAMDAVVVDVQHFHMINERYGKAYGDEVLRRVGQQVSQMFAGSRGIACRREADTFLAYCPSGKDYQALLDSATMGLTGDSSASPNRIRLRMGIYAGADKSIDIERRFDRAKLAADTIRNNYTTSIAWYDNDLHESQLYQEQLLEDFHEALKQRQFRVYYQPKFDIRPEIPVLSSAEALVRWRHPTLGLISPGVFIPLFEDNGLIQQLDTYVWHEAAAQIQTWKKQFGITVPVSVNVSRIDMYDPGLIDTFQDILHIFDLSSDDLLLEITESAYTQDSAQIIQRVNQLRELGFRVEMDDFGTGYSSLNMISALPIDALKLDMQFIRSAFQKERDTRMIEVIIDIANYLGVPVIAEGVETQEQLLALKAMGCHIVQGYYFSRPVPATEYERFIVGEDQEKRGEVGQLWQSMSEGRNTAVQELSYENIAHALSTGFESIYYVDLANGNYVEFSAQGSYQDLQIERSGKDFFADTARNLPRVVYEEDQARVADALERGNLLAQVSGEEHFSLTYRLMIAGEPIYYNMKAVRVRGGGDQRIVIGVSNVNDLMTATLDYSQVQARSEEFYNIAQALSTEFESVYYIDALTGVYKEFTRQGDYETLQIQVAGTDFFAETQKNLQQVVYSEDRARVSAAMEKEALLQALAEEPSFVLDYRLMIDGVPTAYRMKVMEAEAGDRQSIVIGVSSIASIVQREADLEAARQETLTFASIAEALSRDYFSIYYVDTETDQFLEFSAYDAYRDLNIETSGEDFFALSRRNVLRVMYKPDQERFLAVFTKENVLQEIERNGVFTLTYRLMFGDTPTYVSMKITGISDRNDSHIVIGVSNIDAMMRREQAQAEELQMAQEIANRDSLTGVKSKHAYSAAEEQINQRIRGQTAGPLAVVVCDLNGLKTVNDTQGHAAGDEYLRRGCAIICRVFQHSPVYRVGGDEFVVLIQGRDYPDRLALLGELREQSLQNQATGDVVIACGLADFDPELDRELESVFHRADQAMYENKARLKKPEGGEAEE